MTHRPHTPPRLRPIFDSFESPVFFVTFCTANRRAVLANPAVHDAFCQYALRGSQEHRGAVGRYVVMPDHIHLFVCGGRDFDLGLWVRGLKRVIAGAVTAGVAAAVTGGPPRHPAGTSGPDATTPASTTLWQTGFFDHLLRTAESYEQKWHYVRENPVRKGLVERVEDWTYQGEIVTLDRV